MITPGTHTPDNPKENSFIAALYPSGTKHGVALADISTGEFMVYESDEYIGDEMSRFDPREIIIPQRLRDDIHYKQALDGLYVTAYEDWYFDYSEAYRSLLKRLKVVSLDGFGCEGMDAAISAAGALVHYLEATQKTPLHIKKISTFSKARFMFLDATTQRNLEILHTIQEDSHENTLLGILDETLTPMGGRLLRASLARPLVDIQEIQRRLIAVEYLLNDYELIEQLRTYLRKIQDLERLSSRIDSGSAHARDLIAVKNALAQMPKIKKSLTFCKNLYLDLLAAELSELTHARELIEKAIVDSPSGGLKDGGIIKDGYNAEVDELRNISRKGKDYITELETTEKQKTGITSLKIGYNRIFGYYIEVTKTNLHMVPDTYIRKQTLVGGERFITPELKEFESKILGAEEKLKNLEYFLFQKIVSSLQRDTDALSKTAAAIAMLDLLSSFTVVAKRYNYVKPILDESGVVDITDGRHPVLERISSHEVFIPNSIYMNTEDERLLVITGPNMAGKSTFMRQIALIVIMSQIGSFVPASAAHIGTVDRIFTRIGAFDHLVKGLSTFMVEMIEVASITNSATEKSLILLDEVGRGTSTFDGISIAWAVAEYILNTIKAKTLFATHYNELTELSLAHDGAQNYNVSVKEWGDEIIFLRKIEKGPADKSYGIQVARLAGLPEAIIQRAKEVLTNLEKNELNETGTPRFASEKTQKRVMQLDLFASQGDAILSDIKSWNIDDITPDEAVRKLRDIYRKITGSANKI